MNSIQEAADLLREIESELRAGESGRPFDLPSVGERIHRVVESLSADEARWVDLGEAQRLLGVSSEKVVEDWARLGILRSRTLQNGQIHVNLDDVFEERKVRADLTAIDEGGDLPHGELMGQMRPRLYSSETSHEWCKP
jgi:hypothetical protein